jgi:hypothetical protein
MCEMFIAQFSLLYTRTETAMILQNYNCIFPCVLSHQSYYSSTHVLILTSFQVLVINLHVFVTYYALN